MCLTESFTKKEKENLMEGINYVLDDQNNKIAVQIDLSLYGDLWQDFYDRLLIKLREEEESDSLESFVYQLKEEGLVDG
ncbi:MAG: hypothetical protein R2828_11210 [Saprospiraceae bacterium]